MKTGSHYLIQGSDVPTLIQRCLQIPERLHLVLMLGQEPFQNPTQQAKHLKISASLYSYLDRQQIIKCQVLHLRKGSVCAWLARSHQTPIACLLSAACRLAMLMKNHSTTTADSFSRHKSHR